MATFAISAVTRKAQATANGSTTEFSFSFSVNVEADVAVFVGTTLKTISTHYTVSITSSTGAGSITFTSGNTPTNGQIVTIMSKTALARSSVYTSGGTINATSLETDFDTNMMLFQQQDERLDRTLSHFTSHRGGGQCVHGIGWRFSNGIGRGIGRHSYVCSRHSNRRDWGNRCHRRSGRGHG